MQHFGVDHVGKSRLRFVFDDAVVSFSVAADATLEDIAQTFDKLASQHYGNPIAIEVTLAALPG